MDLLNQKINQLNQLLVINNNAEKAYLEALEATSIEELKQFFKTRAFEQSEFSRYIGAEIRMLGGVPNYVDEADFGDKINWPDFKNILATNNARILFHEINRVKSMCLKHYNSTLKNNDFSENLVHLLEKQRKIIGSSISFLRYNDGLKSQPSIIVSNS